MLVFGLIITDSLFDRQCNNMTIPPLSLGLIKGAEWLKALNAEMFLFGQAHGHMNKSAEHTSVHALAGRLQAGPSGNLELTVPSSLIKGVFDALDEPGAEFVVRNNRTECAIKVMTKEEVDKLGGTSHITERGHSYHYTLGPIVELPATGDYDKLWAISIKSDDLEDIRKSYGLETSPQLGFYIPVGCKKKRVTEDNEVSKLAGVYTASGDKVQGVGLRKMYHSLLEEQGLPGLGVNNEDTGDVELSFDGDEAKRQEVFNQLGSRVQAKTGHPVTFAPVDIPQSSVPVSLSNKDTERLNAIHHLAYRMSNMYDPADPLLDSNDNFKQKLADRFRLQVNQRGLKGTVPSRAAEQLLGARPMYEGMMPARRTRSEEEALSDMAEEQKRRLLKALKGGRGFLAPNESGVSKLASLLKKAEGEATPPPIEPISLPSHSPPSGMPAPSIPQGTDFNAMYKAWAKGQAGSGMPARGEGADYARRPVVMRFGSEALGDPQMPVNTSPSGAKQLGTVNFGNTYHTDTDYSRPDYIPAKKISPGVDSGPGVFRVSAHGAGERGNYELSNPGNQPIGIGDGSYTSNMPSSMYNQNPSTVISQACNAGGGCTPATYGNMFKSLNPMLPYNTKPNLNKVVMTPPGFYASGTNPQYPLSVLGESGSAGQPSQYDADDAPYKGNISAYHEYRLAKGGNPSNEAHWTDTGVYNDARQEGLPLVGLGGEALEMARHFNLSPELGGGNFNSYLDKTRRITSNPDASYQEKVRSSWARPIGSAAELARSSAEIVGSADWNKHLDGMNKRVQSKMNKTPSLSTTN